MYVTQCGSVAGVVYSDGIVDIFAEQGWVDADFDSVVDTLNLRNMAVGDWEYTAAWDGHVDVWRIRTFECTDGLNRLEAHAVFD